MNPPNIPPTIPLTPPAERLELVVEFVGKSDFVTVEVTTSALVPVRDAVLVPEDTGTPKALEAVIEAVKGRVVTEVVCGAWVVTGLAVCPGSVTLEISTN
jgi:hypothetical protein